jgi:regulator of ribonuclease activity A
MSFSTCDLCDAHEAHIGKTLHVLPHSLSRFGALRAFMGAALTLRCVSAQGLLDNSRVREAVAENGQGRVLVIDGAGLTSQALLGGNLALQAAKNGWAGVIVHGAVRDAAELRDADLPIRALALCPQRTQKLGQGQRDALIQWDGIPIKSGDWIYADEDGVLVSSVQLASA